MYLNRVIVKNFKAITDMELEFAQGVNLLIGDNGVGKSSMLEAIAVAMSGVFKGISGVSTKGITQNDVHFKISGRGDASSEVCYGIPAEITAFMDMDSEEYYLKKYRESEEGSARTKMKDDGIVKKMQKKTNSSEEILPLLCFQSDARVWQTRRGDFGKKLKNKLNDRRCGYIGCLDYSLDIKGIQEWCLKMEVVAFQKNMKIKEYEAFKHIVSKFMQKINGLDEAPEIYYSRQLEEMVYQEKKIVMPITMLSAGYQSLLWMTMNLAYRWALLNPDITENVEEAKGIVLIDEVDMHLHPKWQWNIVSALAETFPNVQFILTTHSPIVISSAKEAKLILLDENQQVKYLPDCYGYNVEDVLYYRQESISRPKSVKILIDQMNDAIDNDNFDLAEKTLISLKNILGADNSEYKKMAGILEDAKMIWES